MSFITKITNAAERAKSLVCVGLDTDPIHIPLSINRKGDAIFEFNRAIITATKDYVCAYKPNSAFYEALGGSGIETLRKTCAEIPNDIPLILDVKRGDISNTAEKYAEYAYDYIGADAVTVNPYMGYDAVAPFIREDKCVFVLCLTSNVSAIDFQLLDTGGGMLYERVAQAAAEWAKYGEIGLVAGATKPEHMRRIRDIAPELPILVPGVGAQGGDIEAVVKECSGISGRTIINSSRGILYASEGPDFSEAAQRNLIELRDTINSYRE